MSHDDRIGATADHPAGSESREGGARPWLGRDRSLFAALLLLTALLFGYNVQRSYFLGDDSFISFRYARHLAEGHGLVWNPGDRVEGYTNFLWVVLMAGGVRVRLEPGGASEPLRPP